MFRTLGIVLAASMLGQGGVPAEKAFKDYADHAVGGVWMSTNANGTTNELRCEWILDKSFLRLTGKTGDESSQEFHGIDPATGKWTFWGFDDKGRVWKGVAESEKPGVWSFQSTGQGKGGPMSGKDKTVKTGANTKEVHVTDLVLDGKKLPSESFVSTRKK